MLANILKKFKEKHFFELRTFTLVFKSVAKPLQFPFSRYALLVYSIKNNKKISQKKTRFLRQFNNLPEAEHSLVADKS